jgi:hypothetical protein
MGNLHYLKEKLAKAELIRQMHLDIVGASDTVGRSGTLVARSRGDILCFADPPLMSVENSEG